MHTIKATDDQFFRENPHLTITQMANIRHLNRSTVKSHLARNDIAFAHNKASIDADTVAVAEELRTEHGLSSAEIACFLSVSADYLRGACSAARRYGFDPETRRIKHHD